MEKTVLVSLLGHRRPLVLKDEGQVKEAVKQLFSDVLPPGADFFLQIRHENWGEFIDLRGQAIPDRAVLQGIVIEQVNVQNIVSSASLFPV